MSRVKYILANINLLNIILMGFIALFISFKVMPKIYGSLHHPFPTMQKQAANQPENRQTQEDTKLVLLPEYISIAEQNLFHPERKIPVAVKETQSIQRPDFVLYGTLITENLKMAFIDDLKSQYSSRGRGVRQRTLKSGEQLSGYTLSEVFSDAVVMTRGKERLTVSVNDPSKPKRIAAKSDALPPATTKPAEAKGKQPLANISSVSSLSAEERKATKDQKKREKEANRR